MNTALARRILVFTAILAIGHGVLDALDPAARVLDNPVSSRLLLHLHAFFHWSILLSFLHLAVANALLFVVLELLGRLGLRMQERWQLLLVLTTDLAFLTAAYLGVEFYDARLYASLESALWIGRYLIALLAVGLLALWLSGKPARLLPFGLAFGLAFLVGLATPLFVSYRPAVDPPAAGSGLPNVVLVVVDTLRAESMSLYGFEKPTTPNIDRLAAAHGMVFDRAYAQYPLSTPSHTSIYSGCYPFHHKAFSNGEPISQGITLVSEEFKAAGYYTASFHDHRLLNYRWGFAQGFDTFVETHEPRLVDTLPSVWRYELHLRRAYELVLRRQTVTSLVLDWLEEPPPQPFFLWLHWSQPHASYKPPQRLVEKFHPEPYRGPMDGKVHRGVNYEELLTPEDLEYMRARYEGEIAWMDEDFASVVERLRELGIFDNTLIAFTSDHGEALGDHQMYFHHGHVFEESIRVPLFFVMPGKIPAGRVHESVELLNLPATLLRLSGVRQDPDFCDGSDLSPLWEHPDGVDRPPAFAWKRGMMAAVDEDMKLIWQDYPDGEVSLFDLAADPEELVNLADSRPAERTRLEEAVDRLCRSSADASHYCRDSRKEIDPNLQDRATQEQLRALGYID